MLKIFFDGGCRPNPGRMEIAVVARGRVFHKPDAGDGSSEEAEWLALLEALRVATSLGATAVQLRGDAASVINQANRRTKSRTPQSRRYLSTFDELSGSFETLRIRHIRRTQNLAGIALDAQAFR
jgi:ribonuclease HI